MSSVFQQAQLVDFCLAPHGESQQAWEKFFFRLYYRGLEGKQLRLVVRDGNNGLRNAIDTVYPTVKQQPCWAHKLRNVSNKLPRRLQDSCIGGARKIYSASNRGSALRLYKQWARRWRYAVPAAVKCLNEDIEGLLNFYEEPKSLWRKLRTSNIIERCFREVRRRTRPMSCFQNSDSVQRVVFAVFFKLNRSWEKKPLQITHIT